MEYAKSKTQVNAWLNNAQAHPLNSTRQKPKPLIDLEALPQEEQDEIRDEFPGLYAFLGSNRASRRDRGQQKMNQLVPNKKSVLEEVAELMGFKFKQVERRREKPSSKPTIKSKKIWGRKVGK
jgi:hypothetical protein